MGTAASNVNLTVTYKGIDQTTKAGNKARKSIKGIGSAADRAKKRVAGLRGGLSSLRSGDLIGGIKQLGSALSGGGAALGVAGGAAAAVVGIAALGAAAAVAAVKITRMTVETNRLVASADAAFGVKGGAGMDRALSIAKQVGGVGAQNIAKLAATLRSVGLSANITNEQLTELTNRATTMGKTGDDALQAFAKAIETGRVKALNSVGTYINLSGAQAEYAKRLGISAESITPLESRQLALDLVLESLNTRTAESNALYSKQDEALADLDNAFLKLKVAMSQAIGGEAADGVKTLVEFINTTAQLSREIVFFIKISLRPVIFMWKSLGNTVVSVGSIMRAVKDRDFGAMTKAMLGMGQTSAGMVQTFMDDAQQFERIFLGTSENIKREARGISIEVTRSAALVEEYQARIKRAQDAADKRVAAYHAKRKARAARWRKMVDASAKAEIAVMAARVKLNKTAGASEAVLFDARIELINAEEKEQIKAAKRALLTKKGRASALFAIEIAANAKRLKAQKVVNDEAAKAADKADKKAKEAADKRAASFKSAIAQAQALQGAIGGTQSTVGDLLVALPALGAAAATALGKSETKMQDALAIGQTAILGIVAADGQRSIAAAKNEAERARAVEAAERKKAAVLAIMAAAQAAIAFASGNIPGAASAAAAAVLYAGVAGGAIKTGSAGGGGMASTGSTTGGGATMATGAADAAPSTGAINVNFGAGFVFGTKQQVGRAVAGSLRSLQTTGLATAGGV